MFSRSKSKKKSNKLTGDLLWPKPTGLTGGNYISSLVNKARDSKRTLEILKLRVDLIEEIIIGTNMPPVKHSPMKVQLSDDIYPKLPPENSEVTEPATSKAVGKPFT